MLHSATFTVNDSTVDANVDAANLSIYILRKNKNYNTLSDLTYIPGEVVKLIANAYSGYLILLKVQQQIHL